MNENITYPMIKDKEFQLKISKKKEFQYKYDSSEKSCDEPSFFKLAPHQEFVKRFISYNSYYNGLLLYHGLGSGKTCSTIGITEETRKYIKYHKNFKPILIVASENVQENFKLQLFDEHKLKKINGQWVIYGCLGSSLLDEIGLSQVNALDKETIVIKIKKLIRKYYKFIGYGTFANLIQKHLKNIEKLKIEFEDRMIVIDEIHNIRTTKEGGKNEMQKVANSLEELVKKIKYMKLIFLTGTPMFNGAEEIIYMLNILNLNDKHKKIKKQAIFKHDGTLQHDGKEKLIHMANGYVSYVRGENPYTFPHLIPPQLFDKTHSYVALNKHPTILFNHNPLPNHIDYLDLYLSELHPTQLEHYKSLIAKLNKTKDTLNYTETLRPLQCLNISYPSELFDEPAEEDKPTGINDIMNWKISGKPKVMHSFTYKGDEIFKKDKIGEYSIKIKTILDQIETCEGIVLIYSQWIYYGVLPMALALEEMGYSRFGTKTLNLMDNAKNDYSYSIICGNKELSPDINEEIEALTNKNTNGERVKVVIISQTGTEGIDLKNIRQVHILEPWYNMNRLEQVIGRARRNCSHKDLPLDKQNVQIFLHSVRPIQISNEFMEPMDMYLYRLSEKKNKIIGEISKLLKEVSVDCLLNVNQQDFTKLEKNVQLTLSNGKQIQDYPIKDKPFTSICDYQHICEYVCVNKPDPDEDHSTYNYKHIANDQIVYTLKSKFRLKHIYVDAELKGHMKKIYPFMKDDEYEYAVDKLMHETLYDKYDEKGKIIKIHDLLLFHPDIEDYDYLTSEDIMNPMIREDKFEMEPIYIKAEEDEVYKSFMASVEEIKAEVTKINMGRNQNSFSEMLKDMERVIIARNFDYLTIKDQLHLLNYNPIKDILYTYYVKDGNIILNNTLTNDKDKKGIIEVYSLNTIWEKTTKTPKFIQKKNQASFIGYIKLVSQKREIKKPEFEYIATHANIDDLKKELSRQKNKNPVNNRLIVYIIETLIRERNEAPLDLNMDTKIGNVYILQILLELYMRYLEHIDKDTKYFYTKPEIKELKID
jgi:superfamily II DNA or RNA helicase